MVGGCVCCGGLGRRGLLLGGTAMLALSGCAQFGEFAAQSVTPQQEAELGEQAFAQIREETPRVRSAALQQRVVEIARRVVPASGSSIPFDQWDVVAFDSDEVNAFALPGGHIGVYRGILELAGDNDAEVATVMGHEVGHVNARHAAQRIGASQYVNLGAGILNVFASAATGADMSALMGVGAQVGVMLPFSRSQELQADSLGLDYMARAGYDPRAAVSFWQKMAAQGGSGGPNFLSTHPPSTERIEQIRARLPEVEPIYAQSRRS